MDKDEIKGQLVFQCQSFVSQKIETIVKALSLIKEGLLNESKSSVGDKFETTRAHLQQEQSNLNKQLFEANALKDIINNVKIESSTNNVVLGSLVMTSKSNYFISIPAGKLVVNDETYYAISPASPIGRLLLGKGVGMTVSFNKSTFQIVELV